MRVDRHDFPVRRRRHNRSEDVLNFDVRPGGKRFAQVGIVRPFGSHGGGRKREEGQKSSARQRDQSFHPRMVRHARRFVNYEIKS